MEIPRYSPASTEVEMQLRQLANRITGRATSPDDAVEANMLKQHTGELLAYRMEGDPQACMVLRSYL